MELHKILTDLRTERDRIDKAISAIESLSSSTRTRGRRAMSAPGTQAVNKPRRKRRLSPAARKRMSEMMKARWASGKMGRAKKRA